MIYIWTYVVISLMVGALSNRLARWKTSVIAVVMIVFCMMANTLPFVDWKGGQYLDTLLSGVVYYSFASVVLFFVPFLCGRYLLWAILWVKRTVTSRAGRLD
jgi:hypothetical protein